MPKTVKIKRIREISEGKMWEKMLILLVLCGSLGTEAAREESVWDVVLGNVDLSNNNNNPSLRRPQDSRSIDGGRRRTVLVDPSLYMGCEDEGEFIFRGRRRT